MKGALLTFAAGYLANQFDVPETVWDIATGDDQAEAGDPNDVLVDPDKFKAFIGAYGDLAQELAADEEHPIPFEVFLAVAMHESDSGTSELAKNANNFFGVIAKDGWDGAVYDKPTEEEVLTDQIDQLREEHSDLAIITHHDDGRSRVKYTRPFRQYASPEDSFRDFVAKLYYVSEPEPVTYRYADVVELLASGNRNPYRVVELMADSDTEGEARWATGREWLNGVQHYIGLIQEITGERSSEDAAPGGESELPDVGEQIEVGAIDFSELNQPRDSVVVEAMKEGFGGATLGKYHDFKRSGVVRASSRARTLLNDNAYYKEKYRGDIDPEFLVLHLWAIGVPDSDFADPNNTPAGRSHDLTLSRMLQSWKSAGSGSSCAYLLSDNPDGELWQLTEGCFGATNHVGNGIQDEGRETHPGVGNSNAVGIEVQADTIFDVSAKQHETLVYWATDLLFESGKLRPGMDRQQVDRIIDTTVIGHGKAGGLEYGYKYSRPFIEALQQFAFIAVQTET